MSALLELDRVGVRLGPREILHEISLQLHAGEVLGLLGPNGAGKSTLIRLAAGLLRPSSGAVRLAGEDTRRMPRREYARRVALVPQDAPVEFAFRVKDLVAMGRYAHVGRLAPYREADEQAIADGMARAGVTELEDRRVDTLSGGERRLAVFARALAQQSPVLLLDEPTSGLDLKHRAMILDQIHQHGQDQAAVMVALHGLDEARAVCDRVALLDGGRLVALGPPLEVLTTAQINAVYQADPADVIRKRRVR